VGRYVGFTTMWERTICGFRAGGELYLLLIQWLITNVYRCTRPPATVTNPHIVLSLGSKETHIQSHNPGKDSHLSPGPSAAIRI